MFSQQVFLGEGKLDTNQLETLVGESSEDLWEDASLDTIWLDCNESSFGVGHVVTECGCTERRNRNQGQEGEEEKKKKKVDVEEEKKRKNEKERKDNEASWKKRRGKKKRGSFLVLALEE